MANFQKLERLRMLINELDARIGNLYKNQDLIRPSKIPVFDPMDPTGSHVVGIVNNYNENDLKEIIFNQNETITILSETLIILLDGII